MNNALPSIAPIIILLIAGYLAGRGLPAAFTRIVLKSIPSWVMVLLLMMGMELGETFSHPAMGSRIVLQAGLLAGLIAAITLLLFALISRRSSGHTRQAAGNSIWRPLVGCGKAIGCFIAGVALFRFGHIPPGLYGVSSHHVLYLLVALIGMDLVHTRLGRLSWRDLGVPMLAMLGTVCGALLFALITGQPLLTTLAVSSGYGWFSLSGSMTTSLLGQYQGGMAFMTDLLREFFSIFGLYLLGQRYPQGAIALSGAAAMDSALPFVKENCDEHHVKQALVSGFILTLFAPLQISLISMAVLHAG